MSKPLVEYALEYARRGWHVFPCKPSNKAPYIAGGLNSATTDSDVIRDWWDQWPHAMIGVRTGEASGGVDPDARLVTGLRMAKLAGAVLKNGGCRPHTSYRAPHLISNGDRPAHHEQGGPAQHGSTPVVRWRRDCATVLPARRQDLRDRRAHGLLQFR
jgi:hypothetical protein